MRRGPAGIRLRCVRGGANKVSKDLGAFNAWGRNNVRKMYGIFHTLVMSDRTDGAVRVIVQIIMVVHYSMKLCADEQQKGKQGKPPCKVCPK